MLWIASIGWGCAVLLAYSTLKQQHLWQRPLPRVYRYAALTCALAAHSLALWHCSDASAWWFSVLQFMLWSLVIPFATLFVTRGNDVSV
jgi:hypothetical protein